MYRTRCVIDLSGLIAVTERNPDENSLNGNI